MGKRREWAPLIRRCREIPDTWLLLLPDESPRTARSVRERRHPALHINDGRIEALVKNEHQLDAGERRCDIWLRFTPNLSQDV